jgi:endogenous inhibitor of DNA gyrase (YacG/DUF329 family)
MKKEPKISVCPQCKQKFEVKKTDNEFLPFCSKRCKMIDLGHWLAEKYVVEDSSAPTKKDSK